MKSESDTTLKRFQKNKNSRKYPGQKDSRYDDGLISPIIKPVFKIQPNDQIFTIGSCFARNIEEELTEYNVPTSTFKVPREEWQRRPNGLLNEYTPWNMKQRISWAVNNTDTSKFVDTIISDGSAGFLDLLLPGGNPVSFERALERRQEIDAIYKKLPQSDVVIITLGLIEGWYDQESQTFLNRMPPLRALREAPNRYLFRRATLQEASQEIIQGLNQLVNCGVEKIVLTVSPVPLQATFTDNDALVANSFSKSVLRIVAERATQRHPEKVSYFPSYEMVTTAGFSALIDDNIHVKPAFVNRVVNYMKKNYCS